MTELLPTLQAEAVRAALSEYVTTTIELSEGSTRETFGQFLADRDDGIFRGPYLRTRLPFRTDADPVPLDVLPSGFQPYAHQAQAFRRLSASPELEGPRDHAGLRVPEPTIVTTGTGSGKTESFLYPLLDYAVRARGAGVRGVKAIILYPMNALANDQAGRLARMIHENPALNGVTAALYTGETSGVPRTSMSPDGLIQDRHVIRSSTPDIVLTNYKMLDQLLLRSADRPLWEASAQSLRYLVLDEFHTYNGAQGTDVALLIRRLRLLLERLGRGSASLVPVATSATLGDDSDIAPVALFASTIFGVDFAVDAVVTESRLSREQLQKRAAQALDLDGLDAQERPTASQLSELLDLLDLDVSGGMPDADALTRAVLDVLWRADGDESPASLLGHDQVDARAGELLLAHPLVGRLLETTATAVPREKLAHELASHLDPWGDGARWVDALLAALSHVRAQSARNALPNIEAHLWVREVSRVDRSTSPVPSFAWSDDRSTADGSHLPAIYCRFCGRSGWGVALSGTDTLIVDPRRIREENVRRSGRFRALISAPGLHTQQDSERSQLRYLDPEHRRLDLEPPADDDVDSLPVLMHVGLEAEKLNIDSVCPSCAERDAIRFVGSRVATLLSVALSSLFGTTGLDDAEKKSLVFTDSVQDAAHRAGFVEARSHAITQRSTIESALSVEPRPLAQIAEQMLAEAVTPAQRYRLLHPSIAQNDRIRPYWEEGHGKRRRDRAEKLVADRVTFDLQLEAGLVGSYGRTLATTGTAMTSVHADPAQLVELGRHVLRANPIQHAVDQEDLAQLDDAVIERWIRGVLERMRAQGAISHPWLERFRSKGGTRYEIWGGRKPKDAMPAFPVSARSPDFPATGALPTKTLLNDPTQPASWYARWSAKSLGAAPGAAQHLVRPLLTALAEAGITDVVTMTKHGSTVAETHGLRPEHVHMARIQGAARVLSCPECREKVTGLPETLDAFRDGPCLRHGCRGTLHEDALRESYYRSLYSGDMRRVIAREHTGLLDTQTRLDFENAFKASDSAPGSPNVLVATPTLEMGIDIGDLSTVILASIPETVASYLQRVGRAGRLTGSSLDLAFMSSRGRGSAVMEPEAMVNGAVRPPAAYLSAEEILHRQYTAFLLDRMAGDPAMPEPKRAASVMRSSEPGTFLGEMLADARINAVARLEEFLSAFQIADDARTGLTAQAAQDLREWATWPKDGGPSGLQASVQQAVRRWRAEKDALRHRRQRLQQLIDSLAENPVLAEEDQQSLSEARGQITLLDSSEQRLYETEDEQRDRERDSRRLGATQARVRAQESELSQEHWIGVLERYGLLPNFTLFDDAVSLDVTLIYQDEQDQWQQLPSDYERAGFTALAELAPGNTFYADGRELRIDTVDLGSDGSSVHRTAFCPDCGHSMRLEGSQGPSSCPVCQKPGIADPGQHLNVVEMTKVYSTMELHRSRIGDSSDDRTSQHYEILTIPSFQDADRRAHWSVRDKGVAVAFHRQMRLTRINAGRPREGSQEARLAGQLLRVGGFTLCSECGHLDANVQENTPQEHQAWCSRRRAEESAPISTVLSRDLMTESVLVTLPPSVGEDSSHRSLWSFYAALLLGLRERFGGDVNHLRMETVPDTSRGDAPALLLFDGVPGGTGYLAELSTPESLWDLFQKALTVLQECPCQHEADRSACHRCLTPHVPTAHREHVSRARAVEMLTTLLGSDDTAATFAWTIDEGPAPEGDDFESALEKRFLRVFRAAVAELPGARVVDETTDGGTGFHAIIGALRWSFTPQVTLGHTQPDAVLSCTGPGGHVQAAIYLDGRSFHATTAHNRLADDARKREALREQNYLVFGVTDQDVTAFEEQQRGAGEGRSAASELFVPGSVRKVAVSKNLSSDDLAYLHANPVEQLLELLRGSGRDPLLRQRQVADYMRPALFAGSPASVSVDEMAQQALDALEAAPGSEITAPGSDIRQGLIRRDGALVVLAALSGRGDHLAIVLDDREEALMSETNDHQRAWRQWLALSNLRQQLDPTAQTVIGTWTSLQADLAERAAEQAEDTSWLSVLRSGEREPEATSLLGQPDMAMAPPSHISPQWQEAVEQSVTDEERTVVLHAAGLGLPLPEQGEEHGGMPVDLLWPDQHIAWVSDPSLVDGVRAEIGEKIAVFGPEIDGVRRALSEAV